MKIAIFGVTGSLGLNFVKNALEKDHKIVAYVQTPEKIEFTHENLEIVIGDVSDGQKMKKVLVGISAVLISWRMSLDRVYLFLEGIRNVVNAMKTNNVKRIIMMSEYAYNEQNHTFKGFPKFINRIYGLMTNFQQNERKLQEKIIIDSGLDWTINRIRALTENSKLSNIELMNETNSKYESASNALGAKKILYQFEHPEHYIKKNEYF